MNRSTSIEGFTLIETLVYLALYTIIVFGASAGVYSIFDSNARNQTAAMVQEEGTYVISKIDWTLAHSVRVGAPPLGGAGAELILENAAGDVGVLSLFGAGVYLQRGAKHKERLNNTNTTITDLSFVHTRSSEQGLYPESVTASFSLSATTAEGVVLSRSFSTLKYLRK